MRQGFVRAVWGDISTNGIRGGKMAKDIEAIIKNPYAEKCTVYVFGEDSYNSLKDKGFQCSLIDPKPVRYDMKTQLYRHKLDVLSEAMKDYDEIVFLDWDCVPTKKLPADFWDIMRQKAPFQANLFQYRTKKCLWRDKDWRKVCNGGFLYIRDSRIPNDFINIYNELKEWTLKQKETRESKGKKLRFRELCLMFDDEPSFSKWIDNYSNGWKSSEYYWNNFEPYFCNVSEKSVYSTEMLKTKNECFVHWRKDAI